MTQVTGLLSPLKSIRKHCLDCATRPKEVRNCTNTACNLYPYRLGHNPSRKGVSPGRIIRTAYKIDSEAKGDHSVATSEPNGRRAYIATGGGQNRVISKEVRLVEMEAVGKIQMIDRRIIIELSQD
ncbi:MAG: hypothetical protein WCI27_02960 [Candidatus Omnitrophota bacterium]